MTVAALTPSVSYTEDGVTLNFAVPFRYLDPSHLSVKRTTAAGVQSTLAYGADWSATAGPTDSGGTLTLLASVAGCKLTIQRRTPRSQTTDYVANDRFPAETHETTVDRQMLIDQEQDVDLARAALAPIGESGMTLPRAADRAGKMLAFDALGNPVPASALSGDTGLRADLAAVSGASLVKTAAGLTVQGALDTAAKVTTLAFADTWQPGLVAAKFGHMVQAATNDTVKPEIGYYFYLTQSAAPAVGAYKIGLGGMVKSTVNSPELYGLNPVIDGKFGPTFGFGTGMESDVNNRGANADTLATSTSCYGYIAASGGDYRATAGYWSTGYWAPSKWAYGFAATGYTLNASFYSGTDAQIGLDLRGAHTYGIDTRNAAALSYAMMLKNNLPISGVQSNGVTVSNIGKINASNLLELGDTNIGYIQANQSILPKTTNTYFLGGGSFVWEGGYIHTSWVVTCDPSTKLDIQPLDTATAYSLLGAISSISHRQKVGGTDLVEEWVDGEIQETELRPMAKLVEIDGRMTEITVDEEVPVFDEVPIYNADGSRKIDIIPEKPALYDDDGELVREAVPERQVPAVTFKPRMVPGKVKQLVPREREGRRTHYSFNATEVRNALEGLGLNAGLYVRDGDLDMLRLDQFTAILWAIVKDMAPRLSAVEARLG